MIQKHQKQSGFSAVELLITLFIAAAFIGTGYQLYSIIIKDGGNARTRTKAATIAYDNLRRYSATTSDPCVATSSPSPTPAIPSNSGLTNPAISVVISCPFGASSPTSKIQVTVTYGSPQEEVTHALFVNN